MNWQIKKIKEVCDINPNRTEPRDISGDTPISFVSMSSVSGETQRIEAQEVRSWKASSKGYTYFRKGDILFAKITPCMENGKVALADNLQNDVGFGSTEFHVIRAKKDILPKYIFHIVASEKFREEAQKKMTGSAGQKRVPKSFIENYEISLPPLEEQRIIVANIEQSFKKVNEAIRLREKAQSDADDLFGIALSQVFRSKAKKCKTVQIKHVCKTQSGGTPSKSNLSFWEGEIPWVSSKDMKSSEITDTEDHISKIAIETSATKLVSEGTILVVVRSGILKHTLPVAITQRSLTYNQDIKAFIPDKKKILPKYLFYVIKSFSRKVLVDGVKKGATVQSVTSNYIENLEIQLPSLSEQRKIIARLDKISGKVTALSKLQSEIATDLVALKKTILSNVFTQDILAKAPIVSPIKVNIFPLQQAIGTVFQRGFERGEMPLAKVLYLSQEVYGVPLSIPFTAQNFGPYDGSVKKALTAGLSRYNNFFKKRGLVYTLGSGSGKLLQYTNSKLVRQMNEALDDLMPILKNADSASIERLATVCKIIQDFQTTNEDQVISEMKKWKGEKFSDEQVKKSLNFITTQGWDKKLLST